MKFTKMHALGNDFIVIDDRAAKLKSVSRLAKKLCHRRFGIGADQLLLLGHSKTADFRMRVFNADGSEVEMCGNGIRCFGKYIWDNVLLCDNTAFARKYCQSIESLAVETMAGIKYIYKSGNLFRIDMGEPVFEAEKIPVKLEHRTQNLPAGQAGSEHRIKYLRSSLVTSHTSQIMNYPLKVKNKVFKITCVSMGNPHAVIMVADVNSVQLDIFGPLIENHKFFPKRTNVEFVQPHGKNSIKMRVWERGAGETMACGTGASAAAVASALLGLTGRKVNVHLPGGRLLIHWSEKDNHVYMTGPAVNVFDGTIEI
ncbi:MAG: diaminopimelate epimerase [Nitrospiraceae bacterium]|nr:MAG: diaminopimelate epimerase [Nitrospiraceae bacterium]